jgi:hypothetical protein
MRHGPKDMTRHGRVVSLCGELDRYGEVVLDDGVLRVVIGMRARLRRRCRHRLPAVRCGLTLRPPLPLIAAHADQDDQIWS